MPVSKPLLPIAAVVLIGLIVGVTVWKSRQAQSPDSTAVAQPTVDSGESAPAQEVPLADIWAGRARPQVRTDASGGRLLMGGSEQDRARAKREYDALAANLEAAHRSEPIDAAWKGVAETSMRSIAGGDALKQTGFAPQDFASDCRSRSCRVTAVFDTAADAQDWATMFTTMTGSDFRSARYVTVPTADGKTEVRIYGNRR